MVTESRLRAATDILVQSPDFSGGGGDRAERIQSAYALAGRLAHVLRDDEPEPTFSASAWDAFDEWRAELEDEIGFQNLGRIPVELLARYYLDCDTLADATTMVNRWLAARAEAPA